MAASSGAIDISRSRTPKTRWSAGWAWQAAVAQARLVLDDRQMAQHLGPVADAARVLRSRTAASRAVSSSWQLRQVSESGSIRRPISSSWADITIDSLLVVDADGGDLRPLRQPLDGRPALRPCGSGASRRGSPA